MKETLPSHGIPMSSLMEEKTNCVEMVVVNDFVANGILMFSLMEPKTIPTKMRMVDDYQVKGQGIY
jgi:uncharacterized membrane protein